MQATQQMTRPTASTARSATLLLSQRTKKKPRMTSTPHRLYIRLLPSSPKLKWRSVRGVTMVWGDFKKDVGEVSQSDKVIQSEGEEEILITSQILQRLHSVQIKIIGLF